VIAVSAVLISAASFVAAYVQSEAALRQVQAETWPFLQLDHGNTDETGQSRAIYFRLANAGVGPARIKAFSFHYEGKSASNPQQFLYDCCVPKNLDRSAFRKLVTEDVDNIVTGNVPPIIPNGRDVLLFNFPLKSEGENVAIWAEIWKNMDGLRVQHKISATACYCSLLGECYQSNLRNDPVEVKACPPAIKL